MLAFGFTGAAAPSREAFQSAFTSSAGQAALKEKVTLLHCTTEYPTPLTDINLAAMDTLRQRFGLAVGFSDHSEGIVVAIAADGRYAINKAAIDGKGVDSVALALQQAAQAGSVVIISADATAPHQSVITVMEAARRVGLTQITFATQSAASAGR